MKHYILLALMICFLSTSKAGPLAKKTEINRKKIAEHSKQIEVTTSKITTNKDMLLRLQRHIDLVTEMNGRSVSHISNMLTATGITLTFLSIFFAFYLNNIKGTTSKLLNEANEAKSDTKMIHDEISGLLDKALSLDKEISNRPTEYFKKLQNAETQHIFKRLYKVPEDIVNFDAQLKTRIIEDQYYSHIKAIYFPDGVLINKESFVASTVKATIAQHFLVPLLLDNSIDLSLRTQATITTKQYGYVTSDKLFTWSKVILNIKSQNDINLDTVLEALTPLINCIFVDYNKIKEFGGEGELKELKDSSIEIYNELIKKFPLLEITE